MKKRRKEDIIFFSFLIVILILIVWFIKNIPDQPIKPARVYNLEVIREYEHGANRRVVQDRNTGECFHIDDYTGVNETTRIDLEGVEFLDEMEKMRCTTNE